MGLNHEFMSNLLASEYRRSIKHNMVRGASRKIHEPADASEWCFSYEALQKAGERDDGR